MHFHRSLAIAAAALALAGCSAVINARVSQRSLADKAVGAPDGAAPVELRGASLAELVDFALTNRPEMAAAYLDWTDAHLAMLELESDAPLISSTPWKAPSVSASIGRDATSRSVQKLDDLSGRTTGDASGSLSLEVLLWDFGRNRAQVRAQAENVVAAELRFVEQGYSVFEDVASAYFSVLENDALLDVALTNEFEYAERLRQSEDLLSAGEAKKLDVLRARLDLANARESTVEASNNVVTAGAKLMKALGLDAGRGTRDDVLVRGGNALASMARGFGDSDFAVREAFESARTNSPAVCVARAKLRAASDRVDYAVADLLPSISATASLNWTDPLWYWRWGVNGVQSIFTGWRKTTAVDRAVVAMESAASEVDRAEQELSLSLELAVAERDNSRKALATAEESLRQARENLDTVREQFGVGDAGRIEYTDAVASYVSALGSRVKAFYRGQVAEAKLFSLVGEMPVYREERVAVEMPGGPAGREE